MDPNNLNFIEKVGHAGFGAVGGAIGAAYKFCAPKIVVLIKGRAAENEAVDKAAKAAENIKSAFAQVGAFSAPFAAGILVENLASRALNKGTNSNCNNPCEKKS